MLIKFLKYLDSIQDKNVSVLHLENVWSGLLYM